MMRKASFLLEPVERLSAYPGIRAAIECDAAIRVMDGRWSKGFVDEKHLADCIRLKLLSVEKRGGIDFAVPSWRAECSST